VAESGRFYRDMQQKDHVRVGMEAAGFRPQAELYRLSDRELTANSPQNPEKQVIATRWP